MYTAAAAATGVRMFMCVGWITLARYELEPYRIDQTVSICLHVCLSAVDVVGCTTIRLWCNVDLTDYSVGLSEQFDGNRIETVCIAIHAFFFFFFCVFVIVSSIVLLLLHTHTYTRARAYTYDGVTRAALT